jgi:hypothetical protein
MDAGSPEGIPLFPWPSGVLLGEPVNADLFDPQLSALLVKIEGWVDPMGVTISLLQSSCHCPSPVAVGDYPDVLGDAESLAPSRSDPGAPMLQNLAHWPILGTRTYMAVLVISPPHRQQVRSKV